MQRDQFESALILKKIHLSQSALILRLKSDSQLANRVAGQSVNVSLSSPTESRRASPFTIFQTHPNQEFSLIIRVQGTGGVSEGILAHLEVGDRLWVSGSISASSFPKIGEGKRVLCLAAGSGISILGSIIEELSPMDIDIVFVGREEDGVVFPDKVSKYIAEGSPERELRKWNVWNSARQGRPTGRDIKEILGSKDSYAVVVVCGPEGFCELVQTACAEFEIPRERIVVESFGAACSAELTSASPSATAVVDLFGETHAVTWPKDSSLLSAMLDAGLEAPYSCRAGVCSTCQCSVVMGDAEMQLDLGLSSEEKATGLALACQLKPVSSALAVRFASSS